MGQMAERCRKLASTQRDNQETVVYVEGSSRSGIKGLEHGSPGAATPPSPPRGPRLGWRSLSLKVRGRGARCGGPAHGLQD